jgi:hypothetical protein
MTRKISKTIGYLTMLVVGAIGIYRLGYANGRFDLIREPTRQEYVHMGWGYDEAEMVGNPGCAPHLDGNGSACAPKCRPNCFVTDWFRGVKFDD